MSTFDIAADQLKCVRALSVILPDGTLPMPSTWTIHTYLDLELHPDARLEGFFYERPTPASSVLREQVRAYADKFGLVMTEQPHGDTGLIQVEAIGAYQGIVLRVWGPARPDDLDGLTDTTTEPPGDAL